jgi:hypothetical protein
MRTTTLWSTRTSALTAATGIRRTIRPCETYCDHGRHRQPTARTQVALPIGHEAAIKARLTVVNGEKAAAAKRKQWGWRDLPDSFALYQDDGPYLVMPRGYAAELRAGIRMSGEHVEWDDQTSARSLRIDKMVLSGPTLRPEQEQACSAILRHRQGVLQAPTGAGKTVVVLEAWRRTGLTGLILVEKAQLAKQWRERALEHLGVEVGMIGEGEWEEKAVDDSNASNPPPARVGRIVVAALGVLRAR